MARIFPKVWFDTKIIPSHEATLHVGSSAVLYGLSVYTVFPLMRIDDAFFVFRIEEHMERLRNSAKLIGIDLPDICQSQKGFMRIIRDLIITNNLSTHVFARATIHVDELIPGTRSKGLHTILSIFLYEASSIVPQDGVRIKTSPWRRNPDFCIPSRAKVNGAYVNSVLAKQDAMDSGYDDALFLDLNGHVCELSAANIFLVKKGIIIAPDQSSDILEGINRKTILEIAQDEGISVVERSVDMTELYIADEIFTSGTSAYVAPIIEIDGRSIPRGEITKKIRDRMNSIQTGGDRLSEKFLTHICSL